MGMICYDSTMALEQKYSANQNNTQRQFIRRLIDQNMNNDSIYIPNIEQQNSEIYHKNQNLLQETQEECSFQKNQRCEKFFRFWLAGYEAAEYILRRRKKLVVEKDMDMSDWVEKLKFHEQELEMSIREFSKQLECLKKSPKTINQSVFNFQLDEIVLKNSTVQQSIKNVSVLVRSPYDTQQEEQQAFLINNRIASRIQLQGVLETLTSKSNTRQRWSPLNQQIRITKNPQCSHSQQKTNDEIKDMIDALLIKIDIGKKNDFICTTIPISQQLFKHKYPVQQIVKITGSKYSEIRQSNKNEISCISKEAEHIGVILFRIQYIRSDEQEDLKQLIQLCKTRKNIVMNERMRFEGNSMEESEKSLTIVKFGQSFYSDEIDHSLK